MTLHYGRAQIPPLTFAFSSSSFFDHHFIFLQFTHTFAVWCSKVKSDNFLEFQKGLKFNPWSISTKTDTFKNLFQGWIFYLSIIVERIESTHSNRRLRSGGKRFPYFVASKKSPKKEGHIVRNNLVWLVIDKFLIFQHENVKKREFFPSIQNHSKILILQN